MEVTSPRADGIFLRETLDDLIGALVRRGYSVVGPTIRDGTLDWRPIQQLEDLPAGWTASQTPGAFRTGKRDDAKLFGFAALASSLKRYLHPPEVRLFFTESPFHIVEDRPVPPKVAVLGVRACDLAAMDALDRVLQEDHYRADLFLVAVNCTDPADVCFCTTFETGPRAERGFDIALTELAEGFYAEAGTGAGADVLEELGVKQAPLEAKQEADRVTREAAERITRTVPHFPDNFEHPEWERVAARCYGCGNCTQVCPTCFCVTTEDSSDVRQLRAERIRRWDSCFTLGHSYIHGGSVRQSLKSRYRQWLTHKLVHWQDQFGTSGCVGCGRCITWCPAGIDITQVAASLANGGSQ